MRRIALLLTISMMACRPAGTAVPTSGEPGLAGAGATFPDPLYSLWFLEYGKSHRDVEISYQSIGSGGGIKQLLERTVDFGASDAPLGDDELGKAPGVVHLPVALGAVAVTFNLKGISALKLSPSSVAGIYLGEITRWDDPKIKADNAGVAMPALPILVAHRSDSSGTTYVFTDFLSHASATWKGRVGKGKQVTWPVGIAAKGNDGVAGRVRLLNGAIGYVELSFAAQNGMSVAALKNHDGQWVKPSTAGIRAAADALVDKMPADMRLSLVDAPGPGSYPISSYTYILLYGEQQDPKRGKELTDLWWWAIHDGQRSNEALYYAKLPDSVVKRDEARLRGILHDGKPLLTGS